MLRTWIDGLLRQRFTEMAMAYGGIAVAIALVTLIGLLSISSARTMTERALAQVPVDWQIEPRRPSDEAAAEAALRDIPGIRAIERVGYADVPSFEASTGGTTQVTGAGVVVGFPKNYAASLPGQLRMLLGRPDGVVLAQQTAANLHAGIGDTVRIVHGGQASDVRIDGIAELPSAASLLQVVGASPGAAPSAPTDNVLMMPRDRWTAIFAPQSAYAEGARSQFHVAFDRRTLLPSPETAYADAGRRVRNFEVRTAGQANVADNLGACLDAVRTDALYARVLFLFLALPAIVLSLLLTVSLLTSDGDRRRRNEALMRLRGFDRRAILRAVVTEELLGAIGAALVGSSLAALIALYTFGSSGLDAASIGWIAASAFAGIAVSLLCGILPALGRLRDQTVNAGRAELALAGVSLWQKLWLDGVLLVAAFAILWRSAATNYQVVLAPEGVVASAVDYTAFLAPLFLWIGAVLFALRLSTIILGKGTGAIEATICRLAPATALAPVAAASLSHQNRRIAGGVALATLAFSFAFATAIFNRTYEGQAKVDAILTNGADVSIVAGGGQSVSALADEVGRRPGVADAKSMQHRFAYVGNDLQDLYGIDPDTIGRATTLADSYFGNGDARAALAALKANPDGVLVSQETVNDFQLAIGDTLNLRLKDAATGEYEPVPFRFVGVVAEFPTAPKDSFLVANAAYVAKATGNAKAEVLLVRTAADPATVAADLRRDLDPTAPFTVSEVGEATRTIASSLTSVDLGRLTAIERGFAGLLLVTATGLVLALGFHERRRTTEILAALGAGRREIAVFLWSEAAIVLGFGAVAGTAIGIAVAAMLVKLLSGIFDPPPEALSYPVGQLVLFACVGCAAAVLSVLLQTRSHPDGPRSAAAT